MARRRRYRETGRGSFFDLGYDRVLERYREHFLVVLEKLFNWEAMSDQMIRLYKGRGEVGRPPYPPALVFKLLFLSYLYNVSERVIVELADLHLLMKSSSFRPPPVGMPSPTLRVALAYQRPICYLAFSISGSTQVLSKNASPGEYSRK